MNETALLQALDRKPETLLFADVVSVIDDHYRFHPTGFDNGPVKNSASENQGSCRVLAFARHHQLDAQQTLALFAEHYRAVRNNPKGEDHQNIRAFLAHGWDGVVFHGTPLVPRDPSSRHTDPHPV